MNETAFLSVTLRCAAFTAGLQVVLEKAPFRNGRSTEKDLVSGDITSEFRLMLKAQSSCCQQDYRKTTGLIFMKLCGRM